MDGDSTFNRGRQDRYRAGGTKEGIMVNTRIAFAALAALGETDSIERELQGH